MKMPKPLFICIGRSSIILIAAFLLGLELISSGQEKPNQPQEKRPGDFTVKVGVDEVRLDVVALDQKGRQISNLTAEDFEVYQDGQQQKIISSSYISEPPVQLDTNSGSLRGSTKIPSTPTAALTRDNVRRTIVFVIDDFSMSFLDLHNTRMALRRYIENQMQPGDLVTFVRTTGGNAALQTFSSDKRDLLARIDTMQWSSFHATGTPQLLAISYCIKALQEMPGRKFLLLLSGQVMLPKRVWNDPVHNAIADAALRAGVVIHTLDILGIINDSTVQNIKEDANGNIIKEVSLMDAETRSFSDTQGREFDRRTGGSAGDVLLAKSAERIENRPKPLSQKTGGIFLTGNNFFVNGIGGVEEAMKGYYLLSYIPAANTFQSADKAAYHKVKVKVKRPGVDVYTRDGFYNVPGNLTSPSHDGNPLLQAMFSPFRYNGLNLDLTSGYIDDPESGFLLRAWLHLDGSQIQFINEEDGGHSISLDLVAATSDIDGIVRSSGDKHLGFRVNEADVQWMRKNGISVSLVIPAEKPGAYYVRAAVKDGVSGAIGSAYQFVEIPDLEKSGLSLSSIFVLNGDEEPSWIKSGMKEELPAGPDASQEKEKRSQALRRYMQGEDLDYMTIIYNAIAKERITPDLEWQFMLLQNGKEIFRSEPETIDVSGIADYKRIPIRRRLKLDSAWQPGSYLLQVQIKDKQAKGEQNIAAQTLSFEITPKLPDTSPSNASTQKNAAASEAAVAETAIVEKRETVVEMTADTLRRFHPEALSQVEFAQSQAPLDRLLKQAGERVVDFYRNIQNVSAKEFIRMQRYVQKAPLSRNGRQPEFLNTDSASPIVNAELDRAKMKLLEIPSQNIEFFNYIILPGSESPASSLIEYRTDRLNNPVNQKAMPGFIMSSGHAGKCTYLLPNHQPNSYFRYLGREKKKPYAHVIAFAQKPEAGDFLMQYSNSESSAPVRILVEGFVWLDPENYQILRMRTSMLQAEKPVELKATIADIRYMKVPIKAGPQELWLPREINISWELPLKTTSLIFRNQHQYSNYRLFSVASDYRVDGPKSH